MKKHTIKTLKQIVDEQADDAGLWFVAEYASEAYLQSALRKLHAAIENSPWQPIETAPKDGNYVIVSGVGWDGSASACWFGGEWLSKPPLGAAFIRQPTHWMPLPDPPGDDQGKGQ